MLVSISYMCYKYMNISEKGMKILLTVITLFLIVTNILISGCLVKEPIIPDDVAEKITNNLGYALAPTWLPEEYEYGGPFPDSTVTGKAFTIESIIQCYGRYASAGIGDSLIMSYPATDTIPSAFLEMVGLIPPEEAITELEINGNIAYLYQGNWSEKTLGRVAKLEEPIDPEWDYERSIAIRFTVDVPDKGSIWISLSTIFSIENISQKDLVKIAESVVVIE